MSVYDLANKIAEGLVNSQEYKRYQASVERVKKNEKSVEILTELRSRQLEIQNAQMQGTTVSIDVVEELEELSQRLIDYDDVAEFLEAELFFGQMVGDIQETITESVEFWTPPVKNN